jgi:hypothetical protein
MVLHSFNFFGDFKCNTILQKVERGTLQDTLQDSHVKIKLSEKNNSYTENDVLNTQTRK